MNKKTLLLNLIWVLVAAGAFALGRLGGSGDGDTASSKSTYLPVGKSANSSVPAAKRGGDVEPSSTASAGSASLEFGAQPLSADNMRLAVIDALNEPNPLKRNLLFAQLLAQLDEENIEVAMDALRENADGQELFRQMGLFTFAFGAMDGERAVEYAQGIEGRGAVFTTSQALNGWASANPQEAMAWLQGQEDLQGMEAAMFARGLVNGLAQVDLKAATQYALSVEDENMRRQFFDVIAREQMDQGIESASAWVNTLPDDQKGDALYNVARQFAREDLEAAQLWATNYANEPYGANAVAEIADELAESDPAAALEWVSSLPEGDAQSRGMAATFREWGRDDPTAASEYLNSMPDGTTKDQAVGTFAATIAREDPQSAITWASTVSDPEIRQQSMVRAGQAYFRTDPAAAQEWLPTSGLSVEAQEQVMTPPERDDFGRGGFDGRGRGGPGGGRGPFGR